MSFIELTLNELCTAKVKDFSHSESVMGLVTRWYTELSCCRRQPRGLRASVKGSHSLSSK